MWIVLVYLMFIVPLVPSLSEAAYQNPTVVTNVRQANGTRLVTFAFVGNAGEPTETRGYVIQQETTATTLRNWIDDTIKELELVHTAANLAILQPGQQTVPRLARVTTPSAKQVWLEKHERYMRVQNSDVAAIVSARATLKADLEATYQAGFLD